MKRAVTTNNVSNTYSIIFKTFMEICYKYVKGVALKSKLIEDILSIFLSKSNTSI